MSRKGPQHEEELGQAEISRLHTLGYKNTEIAAVSVDDARKLIASNLRNPDREPPPEPKRTNGKKSKPKARAARAAVGRLTDPMAATVPASITDERIQERQAGRKVAVTGVRLDEYEMKLVSGEYPIDSVCMEVESAMPGMHVRAINPNLPVVPGPAFQQAYYDDGRPIEVADLKVMFMPEKEYQNHYVKANIARSRLMNGEIDKEGGASDDLNDAMDPSNPYYAPAFGEGLQMGKSVKDFGAGM